jgi:hypothetical protein
VAAVGVVVAAWAALPASWGALEFFDPPKRVVWAAMLLAVLAGGAFRRGPLAARVPDDVLAALLLAGAMVARQAFAPDPWREVGVLMAWLLPLVAYAAGRSLSPRGGSRPAMLVALAWVWGSQVLLMGVQALRLDPIFTATTTAMAGIAPRMIGTIGYHNQAAAALALAGGVLALTAMRRPVALAVAMVTGGLICLTGCRGAMAGFLVAIALATMVRAAAMAPAPAARRRLILQLLGLGALGVGLALAIPMSRHRLVLLLDPFDPASHLAGRLQMARVAWHLWLTDPFWGAGAGAYAFQYLDGLGALLPAAKTASLLATVEYVREAHMDPLQFLAEFGTISLLLAGLLLARVGRAAVGGWRQGEAASRAGCAIVAFVITYMGIDGMVAFPLQAAMVGPLGGLLLGLWLPVVGHVETEGDGCRAAGCRRWGRRVAGAGWLALAATLLAWNVCDLGLTLAVPRARSAEEALTLATRLRASMPWSHRYVAFLGARVAERGDPIRGGELLLHAERGYRDIPLWRNLGACLVQRGQLADAEAIYRRWAACGLDHRDALESLAAVLEATGRAGEAADVLVAGRSLWPDAAMEIGRRCVVLLLQAGRPAEGLAIVEQVERHEVASARALPAEFENLRGACHASLGNVEQARRGYERALQRNPNLQSARRNLDQLPPPAAP